jgi:predicted AAA+ superfamily ATPase
VQKDIIQRFGISDIARLDEIVKFLFDNIGNETSLLGVQKKLKSSGIDISPTTLNVYIKGLLDSYLIYKCERYDLKGKRILESDAKYYAADIGLRTALLGRQDSDFGRSLENIVYLELLRRGYNVTVGKVKKAENKTVEVDFVATKASGKTEYYQVAWSVLGDVNTLQRELSSLEEIKDNYPKYLLTMDYGQGENNGIKRLNVLQWLMGNSVF